MAWSTRHLVEDSVIRVPGPWTHRDVTANATRFHVAELGSGPLVLLLHGFPQFWWAWRHQMVALADAGLRAVAVDLRGCGASDKPPRGYDLPTAAADVAGLVGALGERDAVLVGHDWGGLAAWTVAELHPDLVRRLVAVSSPHPLRLRDAIRTDPRQAAAGRYLLGFQAPRAPERWLLADNAANVERFLRAWSGPGDWPDEESARRYREAMLVAKAAHSSLEYVRWWFRSQFRPDGRRYGASVATPMTAPVLQVHGARDRRILPSTAQGSGRYAGRPYRFVTLADVGHFPHEESPDALNALLVPWALGEPAAVGDGAPAQPAPAQPAPAQPAPARSAPARSGPATPAARDRDAAGRARNARPRDQAGRPLPRTGHDEAPQDPAPRSPEESLREADALLAAGRPFQAHEVLESAWKAADGPSRPALRGLAQIAVGLTHAQRGNATGTASLLARGADNLEAGPAPAGIDPGLVAGRARDLAGRTAAGEDVTAACAAFRFAG